MDSKRFDSLTRSIAHRGSRRGVIAAGLGLATATVASRTMAQVATPEATPAGDPHPSADESLDGTEFLFVQAFQKGTWAPKSGEEGVFVLTLSGSDANTIYFSDRPERITGLAPMLQFLDGLGFTPANPPNAALVANQNEGGTRDVLLIELFNPVYDGESGTLTYEARVLADYSDAGLAHLAQQQQDYEFAESFGDGSLFIDSCPNSTATCVVASSDTIVGGISIGCCWHAFDQRCEDCYPSPSGHQRQCAVQYPEQCGDNQCVGLDPQCNPPCDAC